MDKKKIILVAVLSLVAVLVVGGVVAAFVLTKDNEVITLDAGDITENTLVVNDEGTIQSALVEEFDKDYYDIDELSDFAKEDIEKFNKANDTKIEFIKAANNDKKAVLVFDYESIEEYSKYNGVKAFIFDNKEAAKDERVPAKLDKYEGDNDIPKSSILEDEKLITVVVDADTRLIINGKIKYYSGCEVESENTVITKAGERAVVIFK